MSTVTVQSDGVTSTLRVEGIGCTDCAALVQRTVAAIPGVYNADVSFATGKLKVTHNPSQTSLQSILQILAQTGHPGMVDNAYQPSRNTAWWKKPQIILLGFAGLLTAFTIMAETVHLGIPEALARILYGVAAVAGGIYPVKSGWVSLKQGRITINLLLVAGAAGAIYLGLWEEAAGLVVIFSLGEVLEAYAVDKARGSIRALVALAPREATVLRNGLEISIPTEQIHVGDIVLVRPGGKIPMDGVVTKGISAVDQSPITGESIPVEKYPGTDVYASTLNGRGALEIRVTKLAQDTTLAKIIHLVEEAQNKKGTAQRFSEKFGYVYTPLMFVLAIFLATVPALFLGQPFEQWLYRALVVLVVSCSCSLILSVPVAIVAGTGNAARNGVLVKGGISVKTFRLPG